MSFLAPEFCICQQTPQLSQIVTEDPRALLGFGKCVAFLFSSRLHAPAPPQLTPWTWLHHPTHRNVRGRVISASHAHGGHPPSRPRVLPHNERRRHARLILERALLRRPLPRAHPRLPRASHSAATPSNAAASIRSTALRYASPRRPSRMRSCRSGTRRTSTMLLVARFVHSLLLPPFKSFGLVPVYYTRFCLSASRPTLYTGDLYSRHASFLQKRAGRNFHVS